MWKVMSVLILNEHISNANFIIHINFLIIFKKNPMVSFYVSFYFPLVDMKSLKLFHCFHIAFKRHYSKSIRVKKYQGHLTFVFKLNHTFSKTCLVVHASAIFFNDHLSHLSTFFRKMLPSLCIFSKRVAVDF
ncbi:hypothetical protein T10_1306 [Trichinella papuae]|uniref:Uncharacterized protein n=1 Tax=Trichinella papuae TaxID=268474 RepID=A0A0V1N8X6_9BILA|nr:hypothetical protein T10_1306 [Trichinella papuae]